MRRLARVFSIPLVSLASSLQSYGQASEPDKVRVIFECKCEDLIGKAYARSFRDNLAKSPRYVEVPDTKANRKNSFHVSAVSLLTSPDTGISLASFSVVFLIDRDYIDQMVQQCGSEKAAGCASTTFDGLDEDVNEIRKISAEK